MISAVRLCGDIIYCRQNFKHNTLTDFDNILTVSTIFYHKGKHGRQIKVAVHYLQVIEALCLYVVHLLW
jgi:hypothetical protein